MSYKHGVYGEFTASKVKSTATSSTAVVYVGVAPINLVRGYAKASLVNTPIKISNMLDAQTKTGYSKNWNSFSLCETFSYHFDNKVSNIGPIYIINVLDPDVHRKSEEKTISVAFSGGRGEFESDCIILDTIAIANKVEGVDFEASYNFNNGKVVITSLNDDEPLEDSISVSYFEVDTEMVTEADIIGQKSDSGTYTGLAALSLLYQRENVIANVLAAPGWSHIPDVYKAMLRVSNKLNGHWNVFVCADIPLKDSDNNAIDTIQKAERWKKDNGYNSEFSKVCWPMVIDTSDTTFHLSTVATATMQRVDSEHNGVPYESPSNKQIMATSQYFSISSSNAGFDQEMANELNENGITTAVYWGGQWVLWGPHTAAYSYASDIDPRAIFDANIRMLMHITNGFQQRNGSKIDSPMTINDRDAIINSEQEILDGFAGMGALIGNPTVLFVESENPESDLVNGDFVWNISVTPTAPLKSSTARVTYTNEGFSAYFFGGEV